MFNRRDPEWACLQGVDLEQLDNGLLRYLSGRVDSENVRDVAQDTWVKVLTAIERGDSVANFAAFTTRVARNVAIDHSRRKKTRSVVFSVDEPEPDGCSEGQCMDMPYESLSILEELERALEKLDDRDQKMIELETLTTLSRQEIARQLGLTEGTLRKYTERVLAKVQAAEKED